MEGQLLGDSDELLFIQNLHSLTDYIRVAQVCVCVSYMNSESCVSDLVTIGVTIVST